jgi:hypothetical protein
VRFCLLSGQRNSVYHRSKFCIYLQEKLCVVTATITHTGTRTVADDVVVTMVLNFVYTIMGHIFCKYQFQRLDYIAKTYVYVVHFRLE